MFTSTYYSHLLVWLSTVSDSRRYLKSCNRKFIRQWQNAILQRTLKNNSNSVFGIKNKFEKIKSSDEYRKEIPISSYEQIHQTIIEQIITGNSLLTSSKPTRYHPTSGTALSSKLIPYTKELSEEYSRGINVWLNDLYTSYPSIKNGRHFWSISPKVAPHLFSELKDSSAVIGFDDDAEYLGWKNGIIRKTMAAQSWLRGIESADDFRYALLLSLLRCPDLTLISVWSPSYLKLLIESINNNVGRLIKDLRNGTFSLLGNVPDYIKNHRIKPNYCIADIIGEWSKSSVMDFSILSPKIWPKLKVLSFWCDGPSRYDAHEMAKKFPQSKVQPKGICATEGIVSIPIERYNGCIPAFMSHFMEFLPEGKSETVLADELVPQSRYSCIITTGGGLYRYQLGDIIEVVDLKDYMPIIRFVGRDRVCDMVGEKLHETEVSETMKVVQDIINKEVTFYFIAPVKHKNGMTGYEMYIESKALEIGNLQEKIVSVAESKLNENFHYKYARDIGQLLPLTIYTIKKSGIKLYYRRLQEEGIRSGDIKPVPLDRRTGWREWFEMHQHEMGE
jgi:hypothetical protein